MECYTLINILDNYNDDVAYISRFLSPKRVVNIRNVKKEPYDVSLDLRRFLKQHLRDSTIIERNYHNPKHLEEVLNEYIDDHTIINISSGDNLSAVVAYKTMLENDCEIIYLDISQEKTYKINRNGFTPFNYKNIKFNVKDYIAITGGKIVTDETVDFMTDDYNRMLHVIINNYELFKQVSKYVRNSNNILHNEDYLTIKLKDVKKATIIIRFFKKMLNNKAIVKLEEHTNFLKVYFINEQQRGYFVSGYWLEHFTYSIIKENNKIDDVHAGVRFLWNKDKLEVENEIDVIAVSGHHLICISCKDTDHYSSGALNELDIYADKLGGENAKRIIVATKQSRGYYIEKRAEEMGINIVIFDGDVDKFREDLNKLL